MPLASRSATVLGLGAVGQDAAVDLGVERLDPAAQHLGRARHLGHLACARCRPRLSAAAVLPLATSSQPRSERPWASSTRPSLSYTDSSALTTSSPRLSFSSSPSNCGPARPLPAPATPTPAPTHGRTGGSISRPASSSPSAQATVAGYKRALDHLDPLVQRLLGVAGQDRDHLLGQDRAGVHLRAWPGARCTPSRCTPAARASRTPCQPGNAGSRAGCVFSDAAREGPVHGLGQDGPEAGHGHQVDLVGHQVAATVAVKPSRSKSTSEAPVAAPVDQLGGGAVLARPDRGRHRVDPTGRRVTGRPASNIAPQDRPGTGDKDRETHGVNLVGTRPAAP